MKIDDKYEELELKAQPGAFSVYDMEILVPEVEKLELGETYMEIGVDKGKSLSVVKMVANPGVRIYGVDINRPSELDPFLNANSDVAFIQKDSVDVAKYWLGEVSVLFIDGDHSYEGCKRDIEAWYPHMKKGGVMLFHDHDESSPGVMWAVAEFYYTHKNMQYKMFKRTDKNTSMAGIWL